MSEQLRRLRRLEHALNTQATQTTAEEPRIAYARKWVVDHDVDPGLLDRWLNHEGLDVDLHTYTVLHEACMATWDAFGEHLPVYAMLFCDRITESTSPPEHTTTCDCDDRSC